MFENLITYLSEALAGPLPGVDAHRKMLPTELPDDILSHPQEDAKLSSILILIYPYNSIPYTIFIKRQVYEGVHSGQISFPGGRQEPDDIDLAYTALREAYEEVGVEMTQVTLLGKLSALYVERSNHLVYPYVGVLKNLGTLYPNEREVQKIICSPVLDLSKQQSKHFFTLKRNGMEYQMPYYDLQGEVLWGATAMIVSELNELLVPFIATINR